MAANKCLVIICISIGALSIALQIVTYFVDGNTFDYVSAGIWGGGIIISTSLFRLFRKSDKPSALLTALTLTSIVCSAAIVGIYAYQLNQFYLEYYSTDECELDHPEDPGYCTRRLVIDWVFVVIGSLAAILKIIVMFNTCRHSRDAS